MPRFTALFLGFSIALSGLAFDRCSQELAAGNGAASSSRSQALHQLEPTENAGLEEKLTKTLSPTPIASPTTGLEENEIQQRFNEVLDLLKQAKSAESLGQYQKLFRQARLLLRTISSVNQAQASHLQEALGLAKARHFQLLGPKAGSSFPAISTSPSGSAAPQKTRRDVVKSSEEKTSHATSSSPAPMAPKKKVETWGAFPIFLYMIVFGKPERKPQSVPDTKGTGTQETGTESPPAAGPSTDLGTGLEERKPVGEWRVGDIVRKPGSDKEWTVTQFSIPINRGEPEGMRVTISKVGDPASSQIYEIKEARALFDWVRSSESSLPADGLGGPAISAGLEEVRFYDGLTESTGAMAPDEAILSGHAQSRQRRAVVTLPAATDLGVGRVFMGPGFPGIDWPGVEEVRLPADVIQARQFLLEAGLEETDLILLSVETVPAGLEQSWRPADSRTPIVAIPASGLEEMNPRELAALAVIARNLEGHILRAGLEEWNKRMIRDERLSIQY